MRRVASTLFVVGTACSGGGEPATVDSAASTLDSASSTPGPTGETGLTDTATTGTTTIDADGDGFDTDTDCDDADPAVFPGAPEHCDGLDADCDGLDAVGVLTLTAPDGTLSSHETPATADLLLEGAATLCGTLDLAGHDLRVETDATLVGTGVATSVVTSTTAGARLVLAAGATASVAELGFSEVAVASEGHLVGHDLRFDPLPYAELAFTELLDVHIVAGEGDDPLLRMPATFAPFAPVLGRTVLEGRGAERTALAVVGVMHPPGAKVTDQTGLVFAELEVHGFMKGLLVDQAGATEPIYIEVLDSHLHDLGDASVDGGAIHVRTTAVPPGGPRSGVRLDLTQLDGNVARTGAAAWVESGELVITNSSVTANTASAADGAAVRVEAAGFVDFYQADLGDGATDNTPHDVSVGPDVFDYGAATSVEHAGSP